MTLRAAVAAAMLGLAGCASKAGHLHGIGGDRYEAQELECVCARQAEPAVQALSAGHGSASEPMPEVVLPTFTAPPAPAAQHLARDHRPASPEPSSRRPRHATGLLVSSDGMLLTWNAAIRGCERIEVTVQGNRHTGLLLHEDEAAEIALVKVEREGFVALAPSGERLALAEPVTVLGYADTAVAAGECRPD